MWEFGRRTRVIVSMCATFPNDGGFTSITHRRGASFFLCVCVGPAPSVLGANDTCFMPTPGHPGARARVCPRVIGCCPDGHLQKTRSSCGPAPAKPLCSLTNRLETFHAPLSLCSHSGQRRRKSRKDRFFSSRNGRKAKKSSNWGKKRSWRLFGLRPVTTRLLEWRHTSWSLTHVVVCLPADGQLRHTASGEPFVFNAREDLHRWNQKRYEALGEVK